MKFTILKVLTSAVTSLALCATVAACGPGGGYRSNSYPSYPSYPSQYSTVNAPPVQPITSSAPQARISVVSTTDTPVGKLQVASPTSAESESKSSVREVSTEDSKTTAKVDTDASKALDATAATSKIADAIKGLVGTWMAVSRQGDGALSTVELQLDDHGWAKLTVPGADGKPSTTTRKVEFENSELKLTGGDADVMLGKLVDFNSRQMVLERSGGQVTFVRP